MSDEIMEGLTSIAAQEIILSLADGVVPHEGTQLFTAGRVRWLNSLNRDLGNLAGDEFKRGRIRIINGRNGDGKTHLMHLIRKQALDAGFAVSYVVISKNTPLFRSDRVYAEIGKSLTTTHIREEGGLRTILNPSAPDPFVAPDFLQKAEAIRQLPGIDPRFATVVYRFCTQQVVNVDQEQDMLLLGAWLEGSHQQLQGMGVNTKIDQTIGNSLLKSLVITLRHFGLRGLVILIDEVESVLSLSKKQRDDSYQTLRLLIDRESAPAHTFMAASTTPPMFTNTERGIQTYPALWSRLRPVGNQAYVNYNDTIVDLTRTPLTEADFFTVGKRIRDIHGLAYNWNPSARVSDSFIEAAAKVAATGRLTLFYSQTRVYVKLITGILDVAEQNDGFVASASGLEGLFGETDEQLHEAATGAR